MYLRGERTVQMYARMSKQHIQYLYEHCRGKLVLAAQPHDTRTRLRLWRALRRRKRSEYVPIADVAPGKR